MSCLESYFGGPLKIPFRALARSFETNSFVSKALQYNKVFFGLTSPLSSKIASQGDKSEFLQLPFGVPHQGFHRILRRVCPIFLLRKFWRPGRECQSRECKKWYGITVFYSPSYRKGLFSGFSTAVHVLLVLFLTLFWGCNLEQDAGFGLAERDLRAPVLLAQQSLEDHFVLCFDEPLREGRFRDIHPALPLVSAEVSGSKLHIRLAQKAVPGAPYLLRASVSDLNHNVRNVLLRIYGRNLRPARLLINELNPEGSKSSNSPEVIEFYVLETGNLGGLLFTVGTREENKGSFVFPPLDVAAGDFVLLHTRWDPTHPSDLLRANEDVRKDQARARLSSNQAWDFWADNISGLSNTNSALALYRSTQPSAGDLMDAVIYSTSVSSARYRGWKTSFLERQVDRLDTAWQKQSDNKLLAPEDAIRSQDSTGTRSLSRRHVNGLPIDTDTAADWIIVPTRGYSFGTVNNLNRYSK